MGRLYQTLRKGLRIAWAAAPCALLLPPAAWAAGSASAPDPAASIAKSSQVESVAVLEERVAVRLRTQRIRLRVPQRFPADSCAALRPADLRIQVGGEPVPTESLVDLERRGLGHDRLLHTILVDTSGSMNGDLSALRDAAHQYVSMLDPTRERAMIMTFDESVVLLQSPTADLQKLDRAIDRVRMGGWTSLRDGVRYAIESMHGYEGRPVLVLLTDGADSHSLYDKYELLDEIYAHSELTIFAVGLKLPTLGRTHGVVSPAKLLAQMANRTHGRFFNIGRGDRIGPIFGQIRDLLDREAIVTWMDPNPETELDPDAPEAKIEIRSTLDGCKVETLQAFGERRKRAPVEDRTPPRVAPDGRIDVQPGKTFVDLLKHSSHPLWKDGCLPDRSEAGWISEAGGRVDGCLLDLVLAGGYLHDAWTTARASRGVDPVLQWRTIRADWPQTIDALPSAASHWMDALAAEAVKLPEVSPRISPLKKPAGKYARPHSDHPLIVNGRTLLDLRPELALAMARSREHRKFAMQRLEERRERRIDERVAMLTKARPALDPAEVRRWILESETGGAGESFEPTAYDLQPFLSAWLGDVAAHDMFVAWELQKLQAKIANAEGLVDGWVAMHRIFQLSSYSRILAPLLPGWDPQERRLGFWRIVLPRPSWMLPRLRTHNRNSDWADLPMDLIPDRPFAFELLQEIRRREPAALSGIGSILSLEYELDGKHYKRDARRAFRSFLIRLEYLSTHPDSAAQRMQVELPVTLREPSAPLTGIDLGPILRALDSPTRALESAAGSP